MHKGEELYANVAQCSMQGTRHAVLQTAHWHDPVCMNVCRDISLTGNAGLWNHTAHHLIRSSRDGCWKQVQQ